MNAAKKAKLEAAGYKVGTVAEFLELSSSEAEIVETRILLTNMVKRLRTRSNLTQVALAAKIHSDQARIARLESADLSISMEACLI